MPGNLRKMNRTLWTDTQTAELAVLVKARLPMKLVARRLGRSVSACYARCKQAHIYTCCRAGDARTGSKGGRQC